MEDHKDQASFREPKIKQQIHRVYNNDDDSSDDYVSPHSSRKYGPRRRPKRRPPTPIGNYKYYPSRDLVRASDCLMVAVTVAMVTVPSVLFLVYM